MSAIQYEKNADNIVILTLDSTGQSANTMNAEFRDSLDEATQKLKAETELSGVIFRSAKKTFFAGGDLDELIQVQPEHATDFFSRHIELINKTHHDSCKCFVDFK